MTKSLINRWVLLLTIHFVIAVSGALRAQKLSVYRPLQGNFLSDTIQIGRPFRYSLVYDHVPTIDVLFPDTARHFAPYLVKEIAVFTTKTNGVGPAAISRDSAVYTLLSFSTDSVQTLQVPVRLINPSDCTILLTNVDTVFLRSALTASVSDSLTPATYSLASETTITPLKQQFNYPVLGTVLLSLLGLILLIYSLFGRAIRQQWQLNELRQRHLRFLREYERLTRTINADTANQAIIAWKSYLERLDRRSYASLTTSEITERMNDERVTEALREADRMIYGGGFSTQSQAALHLLGEIATQSYHRRRDEVRVSPDKRTVVPQPAEVTETSSLAK